MSLQITMRGEIDPISVPGDFTHFADQVSLAAVAGKPYIILENFDGTHMAINQANINVIREIDDDDDLIGS